MLFGLEKKSSFAALVGLLVSVVFAPSAFATSGTFHGIASELQTCQSCHSENASGDAGGLKPEPVQSAEDTGGWYNALVGAMPTNETARGADKLRVHPGLPWNSYIIDKLTGDLKPGEGEAMRGELFPDIGAGIGEPAEVFRCPGVVDEFYNWILGGAPDIGETVPGDYDWSTISCSKEPHELGTLDVPAPGFQVNVDAFTVTRPDREASRTVTVPVGNAGEAWVDRIEILASSGTEYLAIHRVVDGEREAAPIAVARGQINPMAPRYPEGSSVPSDFRGDRRARVDLVLPEGVAIHMAPDQQIEIEQRLRNDYWVRESDSTYRNETVGDAIVNFHTVPGDSVTAEASPFMDTTGTDTLAVPPRAPGVTGGAWTGTFQGAVVGLWTDQRSILSVVSEPTSSPVNADGPVVSSDVTEGYVSVTGSAPLPSAVAYTCVHSNGFHDNVNAIREQSSALASPLGETAKNVSRPIRYGCTESSGVPAGLPGEPADVCYQAGDCGEAGTCEPANLVGGPGVHDGRCTLIGLSW